MIAEHSDDDIIPHLYHRGGIVERHESDTLGTILAVAKTEGLAPAMKVVVRQGVWDRIVREFDGDISTDLALDFEVDESIPFFPGFEVHREMW